ncbi:MAG: metal ABC transporter substrate-binding protein [Methyloligella sp. ZOD6]
MIGWLTGLRFAGVVLGFGAVLLPAGLSIAEEKVKAVASFSILGDMVRQVGGDRVAVTTFVEPDGDPHDFEPTPAAAKQLAQSDVLFVNGLGLEGWLPRLEQASAFTGETVIVSEGIETAEMSGGHDHHHDGHDDHGHDDHGHDEPVADPHAWQSLADGKIYVENIRDGLIAADPAGKAVYEANAAAYLTKIDALDKNIRAAVAEIPKDRRVVVTSHDAFGYFGREYGIRFLAPHGVATESEASAKAVAEIIDQVRAEKIPAVFLENVSDPRLLNQIASETGAKIGGTLYSDALSGPDGPAPTYLAMIRHNMAELSKALQPES